MSHEKEFGDWKLFDCLQYINKLFLTLELDAPLNLNLRHIFATLLGKFMIQSNSINGIHFLYNFMYDPDEGGEIFETHHLYINKQGIEGNYLIDALKERQLFGKMTLNPPPYIHKKIFGFEAEGWQNRIEQWMRMTNKNIGYLKSYEVKNIIQAFNDKREKENKIIEQNSDNNKLSKIICRSKDIMLIPFNFTKYRLGFFLLWNNEDLNQLEYWRSLEEINYISKTFQQFVARLLSNHYHAEHATYLPSYRKEGSNNVAISFSDIRSFTTMTEISRNRGFASEFHEFVHIYFKKMTEIIEKWKGRVEKFSGDSIMFLFGEYDKNPQKAVGYATTSALEMYDEFQKLKEKFMKETKIKAFLNTHNEPLEFDLGIGINYGEVLFGYFGKSGARQYMALGDHVNFANRLEFAANRFDSIERRQRAPILISRTAYNLAKDYFIDKNGKSNVPNIIALSLKGKSYEYPIYEVWPSCLKNVITNPSYSFLNDQKLLSDFPISD